MGKLLELLKLVMVFEVLSLVGAGPHILKYHVIYTKFLIAKTVSRQILVSSGGLESPQTHD